MCLPPPINFEEKHKMTQWFSDIAISGLELALLFSLISALAVIRHLIVKYHFLEKQLNQLTNEVRAINSGNLGMGRKIHQFAEDIANVDFGHISGDLPTANDKIYQQAGLLLSRGATIEEVVESCDIAPAEAELLAIMRHSSAAKTASV